MSNPGTNTRSTTSIESYLFLLIECLLNDSSFPVVVCYRYSCRQQIVSFLASALGEKEIFGGNSANSIEDLYEMLCRDSGSPSTSMLLKDLAEELANQEICEQVGFSLPMYPQSMEI